MSALPEYSGDFSHCWACGNPEAETTYVPRIKSPSDAISEKRTVHRDPKPGPDPFLKRTCTRCGYTWAEQTVR